MQSPHDAANSIRLRYADKVNRIDFVNGGSSMVSRTSNKITEKTKDGLVAETYVKGEVALSIIGSAGAQAKIQSGEITVSVSYGVTGKFGASATLTGGVSVNKGGPITRGVSIAHSQQLPYFMVTEGKFSYDIEDADLEAILGAGVGVSAELPMYQGEGSLSKEIVLINIKINDGPTYPMYYQEWHYHLGGW